ncbi:uncharacterized protein LOC131623277 [Vicia villosa]|uniref:uncharacterized protein LOC131623277 n=1 Tax=Vicia villosa TaxID=3911 RepID=UPI00273CAFE5|nr:uncharacterized protein LOC131623277 [Vicia villosa]
MNNEVDNHGNSVEESTNEEAKKGWRKVVEIIWSWMAYKNKNEWLDQMRGNLCLTATIIATMTFQMALNPPGGVRPVKDDGDKNPDVIACSSVIAYYDNGTEITNPLLQLCPGEAVLGFIFPDDYFKFLYWNTICFVASLSVLLMLVCGFRLNHRFPMWLLSIGMCLTLTSLVKTYLTALSMVTPGPLWIRAKKFQQNLMYAWIVFSLFSAMLLTLRFAIWLGYEYSKSSKREHSKSSKRENTPPA